ncbi:Alpha/Beta hydrolase protein [Hyaloraphidium curvatum]|nr:Alpha/Beta hydrolase protein [Hyaloraphidium curvatum]
MADVASEFQDFLRRSRKQLPPSPLPVTRRGAVPPRVAAALAKLPAAAGLRVDSFVLTTELGSDNGKVPLTVLRPKEAGKPLPTILVIHFTGSGQEAVKNLAVRLVGDGFCCVTIDARYHGERAVSSEPGIGIETLPGPDARTDAQVRADVLRIYHAALARAWREPGSCQPFLLDSVWDCHKVADWISCVGEDRASLPSDDPRREMDHLKLGITGISLGGMISWLSAAADTRYRTIVPIIGLQSFTFSLKSPEYYRPRIDTILPPFTLAAQEAGTEITADVVRRTYDRIAPGLLDKWDAQRTVPSLAPRACCAINGERDPRNPIAGIDGRPPFDTVARTKEAYDFLYFNEDAFELAVFPAGHEVTPDMTEKCVSWFRRWLRGAGGNERL